MNNEFECYLCEKTYKKTSTITHYSELKPHEEIVSLCDDCLILAQNKATLEGKVHLLDGNFFH